MYSWVFRHRARLRVIYGVGPAPSVAGCKPVEQDLGDPDSPQMDERIEEEPGEETQRVSPRERLEPGAWARRNAYVILRPMRTGAA